MRQKGSKHPHSEETKKKMSQKALENRMNRVKAGSIGGKASKPNIFKDKSIDWCKGSRHWNWKGGISNPDIQQRKSGRFKRWREAVFQRDDYTCQMCYRRGCFLEPHHIKRFVDFPDLRFELSNGVTLCSECHNKTKFKEELFEYIFQKIIGD